MSSGRVQMSFTGVPGISLAISTDCTMKSFSRRRPNPPPMNCGQMRTCSGFTPAAAAAAPCAPCGNCVLAQMSTPSAVTRAMQFCGSSVACESIWHMYVASIGFALAKAEATSPAFFATTPSRPFAACSFIQMPALSTPAPGPSSHVTFTSPSAVRACQ